MKFKFPKVGKIKGLIPHVTEAQIVNFVFTITPWITPVITAWLVFDFTQLHLGWSWQKALFASAIVEGNGISSTNLVLFLYRERASKPLVLVGWAIVGVYVLVVGGLTLLLDTFPAAAKFSPLLFILLVLSSSGMVAIRSHVKAQAAQARKRGVAKPPHKASDTVTVLTPSSVTPNVTPNGRPEKSETTREKLIYVFQTDPESRFWTSDKLAERVGCTAANVRKIAHKNGQGWEL